jgi:hypothetical protein
MAPSLGFRRFGLQSLTRSGIRRVGSIKFVLPKNKKFLDLFRMARFGRGDDLLSLALTDAIFVDVEIDNEPVRAAVLLFDFRADDLIEMLRNGVSARDPIVY